MKINWVGPFRDSSGYGEFSRAFIVGLNNIGADVVTQPLTFEQDHADHGVDGKLCLDLAKKSKAGTDINIINMIPRFFAPNKRANALNIGFTMFEGTKLPDDWAKQCNEMDAIFVPSHWNKEIFISSGVTKPIYIATPGVNPIYLNDYNKIKNKAYNFYSIFEWTERKNPLGLLRTYWSSFTGRSDVNLRIKTSRRFHSIAEVGYIQKQIEECKKSILLKHYPEVEIITNKLSTKEMLDLHINGDCFVLPHRAEGIGMPHMEAMAMGKPIIATNYSGVQEYMSDNVAFPIKYNLSPIHSMDYLASMYQGDTWWADADLHDLSEKMKKAVNNTDYERVGAAARNKMQTTFTWEYRAQILLDLLKDIYNRKGK